MNDSSVWRSDNNGTRFTTPVPPGELNVTLREGLVQGRWLFRVPVGGQLSVDYLDPRLCTVEGAEVIRAELPSDFIPTPRLRLQVNGRVHDLVSSDPTVLERHYSRSGHQERVYGRTDRWTLAYHQARLRQVRRLLSGVTGRVCDIGSGHSLIRAAGSWSFDLSACDRDPEVVEALRAQGIDARLGDVEAPPFSEGSFDAVYAGEIIEHLPSPEAALRRWVQLLRPGGRLALTTPNRRHLLARISGSEKVENPEHLFEWDVDELRGAVSGAGAVIEGMEGLHLPIPVYLPGGWRDLAFALLRRMPVPQPLLIRYIEVGRLTPSFARNVAVLARRER